MKAVTKWPGALRTLAILALFILLLTTTLLTTHRAAATPWWSQSINVESKVGTDRSIQSLDVMYPLSHTNSSLTFTDLRGRIDDDDSIELNLGLAHRSVTEDPLGFTDEAVLGYYGFADRLESQFDNTFYQATAGFEYFTKDYSLRINGYFPEDERKQTFISHPITATGTQIYFEDRQNYERPLPGYDVEIGRTIRFDGWQLYGRGSHFRFHHSDVAEIEGERFRAGIQFDGSHSEVYLPEGSQLTLGVEWQNDDVREEQTFGIVRMRIPFGSSVESRGSRVQSQKTPENSDSRPTTPDSGLTTDSRLPTQDSRLSAWQKDRLTERISRDVDVVTGQNSNQVDTQPAVLATSGETLTDVAVAESGARGNGTPADPGNLTSAINTAGDSGTVFVVGELRTEGVTLQNSQAVIGGNLSVIESADGSETSALMPASKDAHIEGTTSDPTIRLDTGTSGYHLRGFSVSGEGEALRVEDDVGNARLSDLTIESGDLVIRGEAGDGTDHQFILERIDVESGDLTIGNRAGSVNGEFTMDTVAINNGFLDIGDRAGGLSSLGPIPGGHFEMNHVNVGDSVSVGDSAGLRGTFSMQNVDVDSGNFSIGEGAGSENGEFTMDTVAINNGFLDIGDRAGGPNPPGTIGGGPFEMNHVDVSDSLAIGNRAGESGSFTLANSSIQDGVKIGQNAGYDDGSVNLIGNTIVAGGLTVDMWRNGGSGTVNIIDNTTLDGSVDVSSFINALGGTVNCSINTPRVDPLQCQ